MRLRAISRDGAEDGDGQPRKPLFAISWPVIQNYPRSKTHSGSETGPDFRKLNRQIAELTSLVTLRKQITVNCSNRQKKHAGKHQILTQKLHASSKTSSSAPTQPSDSRISNRELTMRRASAFRASNATRGICFALSNRELLGLEILQLAENKRHRHVLIANFEPNLFPVFQPDGSR
jgi:hypothetical protein